MVLLFLQAYAMLPQLAASLLSPLQVLVVGVGFGALLPRYLLLALQPPLLL